MKISNLRYPAIILAAAGLIGAAALLDGKGGAGTPLTTNLFGTDIEAGSGRYSDTDILKSGKEPGNTGSLPRWSDDELKEVMAEIESGRISDHHRADRILNAALQSPSVRKDEKEILRYIASLHLMGARIGRPDSLYKSAVNLLIGAGVQQDRETGISLMKNASSSGHAGASAWLARHYAHLVREAAQDPVKSAPAIDAIYYLEISVARLPRHEAVGLMVDIGKGLGLSAIDMERVLKTTEDEPLDNIRKKIEEHIEAIASLPTSPGSSGPAPIGRGAGLATDPITSDGMLLLANRSIAEGRPEKAIAWLQEAALLGRPEAQYALGMIALHGEGILQDARFLQDSSRTDTSPTRKGVSPDERSEERQKGHPEKPDADARDTGFRNSSAAPSGPDEALFWLEKASLHGHQKAIRQAAIIHLEGLSARSSAEVGLKHLHDLARGGDPDANFRIGSYLLRVPEGARKVGVPGQSSGSIRSEEPRSAALQYLKKAAAAGHKGAETLILKIASGQFSDGSP